MKTIAFLLAVIATSTACADVTYKLISSNYTSGIDYTPPCQAPVCANYNTSMRMSGDFSVITALPPNLNNQDITPLLIRYRFNDGINTYLNSGPAKISSFKVTTDATGTITDTVIDLYQWQTEPNAGGYFNCVEIYGSRLEGHNARICLTVSGSNCTSWTNDSSTSIQFTDNPATWLQSSTPPNPIPTLSEWAQMVMMLMMLVTAGRYGRRLKKK